MQEGETALLGCHGRESTVHVANHRHGAATTTQPNHTRHPSTTSSSSSPRVKLRSFRSPTPTRASEELQTPPIPCASVFDKSDQCALSVGPSSHINMNTSWNGNDAYIGSTLPPGCAMPDLAPRVKTSRDAASVDELRNDLYDLPEPSSQHRRVPMFSAKNSAHAVSPTYMQFVKDVHPDFVRQRTLSSPTLGPSRYTHALGQHSVDLHRPLMCTNHVVGSVEPPAALGGRATAVRTHRRKLSHHTPRPPTPPRRGVAHTPEKSLSSPILDSFNDELISITGAAEVAIRRRTRSATGPKSPPPNLVVTRLYEAQTVAHRRTTSLGGDRLENPAAVYRRARSASKVSQLATDDSPPMPRIPLLAHSNKSTVALPTTMNFADSASPRAPPPPPIVVPIQRPATRPQSPFSHSPPNSYRAPPQRSLPSPPSPSIPKTAPILTSPFQQLAHMRSPVDAVPLVSPKTTLHRLPRNQSFERPLAVPSSPPVRSAEPSVLERYRARARAKTLTSIHGIEAAGDDADYLIETIAAVREAAFWEWPMPPPRRPSAPLSLQLDILATQNASPLATPSCARKNATPSPALDQFQDASDDEYLHGYMSSYASSGSGHPFAYQRDGEFRQSDHSHDLHSSTPSSDIGPLTPDDETSPFERPLISKQREREHLMHLHNKHLHQLQLQRECERERTPRAARGERYGTPF